MLSQVNNCIYRGHKKQVERITFSPGLLKYLKNESCAWEIKRIPRRKYDWLRAPISRCAETLEKKDVGLGKLRIRVFQSRRLFIFHVSVLRQPLAAFVSGNRGSKESGTYTFGFCFVVRWFILSGQS